jgi:hypothetical protein
MFCGVVPKTDAYPGVGFMIDIISGGFESIRVRFRDKVPWPIGY